MASFAVIMAAAGQSSRFRDPNFKKPFALLNQKAVWLYSAEKFLNRSDVKQLILVVSPEDRDDVQSRFGANLAIWGVELVEGGAERCLSIERGLARVKAECDHVVIHDAARPCLAEEWIDQVLQQGVATGAAILATPVTSTLKRSADGRTVAETVDRQQLWLAQTPQVFRVDILKRAFEQRPANFMPTDEAQLVEAVGVPVTLVPSSNLNIKITTKSDLAWAAACLKALPTPRFDAPLHPFADDRLWR